MYREERLLEREMAGGLLWATRAASYLRISVPFRAFSSGKINGKTPHTFHCSLMYDMTLMKVISVSDLVE